MKERRALLALLLVVGVLSLAALACNSDQEWIIPRTATPTITPSPLPISMETRFQVGDRVIVVAEGTTFMIYQTNLPEPDRRNNRVMGSSCFPNTTVTILDVAQGADGDIFYKVRCTLDGWLPEANLAPAE